MLKTCQIRGKFIYLKNNSNGIILYSKMKDYRDRFIWKPFIDKLKKDESMSVHYINGMILDLNEGDNIIGNNIDNIEMIPNYNTTFYNENLIIIF